MEQQRRWNREKNIRTAESKLKQIERLKKTLVAVDRLPEDFSFHFPVKNESGNDVLKGTDLSFAYGAKEIFHDVNIDIKKGERIFLLGPNGCGKTTLFKMLCSRLGGTKGYISLGSNVDIGYYDQTQESLHNSKNVLYEVWDEYPRMTETEVSPSPVAVTTWKNWRRLVAADGQIERYALGVHNELCIALGGLVEECESTL